MTFLETLFDKVAFDQVVIDQVVFDHVVIDQVVFDQVSMSPFCQLHSNNTCDEVQEWVSTAVTQV